MGNDEFRKGNMGKAIEYYTYATEMDPNNHFFFTNRAAAYAKMKKWEKSLRDSNKALKLQSDWHKGYWRKGDALMALGRPEEAMKAFEQAKQLDPSVDMYQNKYKAAKKAFYKDKSSADMKKMEGNELYKVSKIDEAIQAYTDAIDLCDMKNEKEKMLKADILANRALCYRQLYNSEAVITDCTQALEINPMHVKAYIRRAQALEAMEKFKAALEDFSAANRLAPSMAVAYKGCSRIRAALRQRAKEKQ